MDKTKNTNKAIVQSLKKLIKPCSRVQKLSEWKQIKNVGNYEKYFKQTE